MMNICKKDCNYKVYCKHLYDEYIRCTRYSKKLKLVNDGIWQEKNIETETYKTEKCLEEN